MFVCVPNFSEGRDAGVVRALGDGEDVLDVHADRLHNRTVVTLAGADGSALAASVLERVSLAVERLDLRRHSGLHPRVGVADVVPVAPLGAASLDEAAALAASLGQSIWDSLGVPVWFYGPAFGGRRLADIRRGRAGPPDLGGPALHPSAGAVCVGARPVLVAYNVEFEGLTLDAARAAARAMRELSGVQALVFELPGSAVRQLSLNLTAPFAVGAAEAFAAAVRLAGVRGTPELVGLCPAGAAGPGCDGGLLEARLAASAARRGAAEAGSRSSRELQLLSRRLTAEASVLGGLEASPEAILGGAERAAALVRVLRAGGILSAETEALLDVAARGFRAAIDPATAARFDERVRLLDRWLEC